MDARSIKRRVCKRQGWMLTLRALVVDELRDWDQMAPVGREFGSPDFERLMATGDTAEAEGMQRSLMKSESNTSLPLGPLL